MCKGGSAMGYWKMLSWKDPKAIKGVDVEVSRKRFGSMRL